MKRPLKSPQGVAVIVEGSQQSPRKSPQKSQLKSPLDVAVVAEGAQKSPQQSQLKRPSELPQVLWEQDMTACGARLALVVWNVVLKACGAQLVDLHRCLAEGHRPLF